MGWLVPTQELSRKVIFASIVRVFSSQGLPPLRCPPIPPPPPPPLRLHCLPILWALRVLPMLCCTKKSGKVAHVLLNSELSQPIAMRKLPSRLWLSLPFKTVESPTDLTGLKKIIRLDVTEGIRQKLLNELRTLFTCKHSAVVEFR